MLAAEQALESLGVLDQSTTVEAALARYLESKAPQRLILPWLSESDRPTTFLDHPSRPFKHYYVALEETRCSLAVKLDRLGYSETIRAV